jgi:hypothetical protein
MVIDDVNVSDLSSQPLDDGITQQLRMGRYARNGCPMFGTTECTQCTLVCHLPRSDCDPPNECPSCEDRERCPCGNNVRRIQLLKDGEV